jgi:hypothetical protein
LYAFLGNYTTLPGYLRYLERGRTSASGAQFDISVIIGMIKTILWMFSFQLGIYFTALGILKLLPVKKVYFRSFLICGLVWLLFAGIPKLPYTGKLFYALFGLIILILVVSLFIYWYKYQKKTNETINNSTYFIIIGYVFFALASWDVCGLGTTGRILHIEDAIKSGTQGLIITQTTKIMIEFVLAWFFSFLGHYLKHKNEK